MSQALLKVTGLKKAYGAIQAVGGVSFPTEPLLLEVAATGAM